MRHLAGVLALAAVCAAPSRGADMESTAGGEPQRALDRELFAGTANAVATPWPGIGCWFWTAEEFEPEGYKRFLDLHARHSAFRLLTTSIRHPVEVTDPAVHDQIRAAADYARTLGMEMVMDLDVRLARQAFMDRYPHELQELVRLREAPLAEAGETSIEIEGLDLGDHYTFRARPYESLSARVLRVYSYTSGPEGLEPNSVADVTDRCRVVEASGKKVHVSVPAEASGQGRTACVLAAFTLFTPDVFAPHLIPFEREILERYVDVALAGACKDEWGFPGRFDPRTDDLWYSTPMAEAYADRRPGRDLAADLLLMVKGGPESDRTAAVNHYMDLCRTRNAEVEAAFYRSVKEVFGPTAMVATHPTWFPYPGRNEIFKNGLHWWSAPRDLAQTDETTPYAARTALAKKWNSPVWYNMFYDAAVQTYEQEVWRHALGGGRINFHPLYPRALDDLTTSLLGSPALRGDSRVRLLNLVSASPVDCPVAVIFGHASALNWTGPGFADVGMAVADGLWEQGQYADLIPSSEIASGALRIAEDGSLAYGPQRYAAAVLYGPEYEPAETAVFFQKVADAGRTALFRVGDWTRDFQGNLITGKDSLPASMQAYADAHGCVADVLAELVARGIAIQTPGAVHGGHFAASVMPGLTGRLRLIDGTRIRISGESDPMGDPIRETFVVEGHEAAFDAVGVAAVRIGPYGSVEAMAGGGLRSFRGPDLAIELEEPVDLALWRTPQGEWQGVVQGWKGPLPEGLVQITRDWTRLVGSD